MSFTVKFTKTAVDEADPRSSISNYIQDSDLDSHIKGNRSTARVFYVLLNLGDCLVSW